MIFIAGVYPRQKRLEYDEGPEVCKGCGRYGRYQVYMEYNTFSLFFIPIIKWKKRYFVVTTCCGERAQLDPEVGERIERGESIRIREEDLIHSDDYGGVRYCNGCGQPLDPSFTYCPNCGEKQQ